MKKILITLAAVIIAVTSTVNAQNFGHINMSELIESMPERKTAEEEYNKFVKSLEEQMTVLQDETTAKFSEYQTLMQGGSVSDIIRQSKEDELNELNQRVQSFRNSATQQIQKKEKEIMIPLIEKAKETVVAVGEDQGLIYVFDISAQSILYKSSKSIVVSTAT